MGDMGMEDGEMGDYGCDCWLLIVIVIVIVIVIERA